MHTISRARQRRVFTDLIIQTHTHTHTRTFIYIYKIPIDTDLQEIRNAVGI